METIFYTPSNVKGARTGGATIRINRKSCIAISKTAIEVIGLEPGDCISLAHDKKNKEWFIVKQANGFKLRGHKNDPSLKFNCAVLGNMILDSIDLKEKSYSMMVATEPSKMEDGRMGYCILTSTAKV